MRWFGQLSFKSKILITVAASCVICGSISLGVAIHYNEKEFQSGLVEKSRIIHGRLDVAARYVANQGGLKPMIERMTKKYPDPSQLTKEDKEVILQQVPIYAAMKIGAESAEKDHYQFRVFSNEARNKENKATLKEMEIFERFEKDPNLNEFVENDDKFVTVYRPVRLSEQRGCLNCHGNPATSPWKNGDDILGYKMEDWKDGKLHGVFAISNDIAAIKKAQADKGGFSSTTLLALFIFIGSVLALLIAGFIVSRPIKTLAALAGDLSHAGDDVSTASDQIAASSQSLSQASTEQAAALQETAASLEEINAMINKAADRASMTATSSSESQRNAEAGRSAIKQMISSMDEITRSNNAIMSQVNDSNQKMAEIVSVIQEIGAKTKVINEIVFQTKLLSFNASVEAARAGEHGKGFAVVAEEVGNLAQMSGNAAKEISDMLGASMTKVEGIVNETKTKVESLISNGKEKVEIGVRVANQCSDALNEIVQNVSKVSSLAQDISQASSEQALGVGEINKAMGELDTVTQQNSATSEETANAAAGLSRQAETLKSSVLQLAEVIHGGGTNVSKPPKHVNAAISAPKRGPKAPPEGKVVQFKKSTPPPPAINVSHATSEAQQASGSDIVPNHDDERFKEI